MVARDNFVAGALQETSHLTSANRRKREPLLFAHLTRTKSNPVHPPKPEDRSRPGPVSAARLLCTQRAAAGRTTSRLGRTSASSRWPQSACSQCAEELPLRRSAVEARRCWLPVTAAQASRRSYLNTC